MKNCAKYFQSLLNIAVHFFPSEVSSIKSKTGFGARLTPKKFKVLQRVTIHSLQLKVDGWVTKRNSLLFVCLICFNWDKKEVPTTMKGKKVKHVPLSPLEKEIKVISTAEEISDSEKREKIVEFRKQIEGRIGQV